jgi:hypothetical protein
VPHIRHSILLKGNIRVNDSFPVIAAVYTRKPRS